MQAADGHIVIIGAGFAGLGMGRRLRERGVRDFTILERAAEVGGTWRDNRYPGAACDVPSHLYSFSFAPNPEWTRRYAPQSEIQSYLVACADRFGLREHLRCGVEVTGARYDDASAHWLLATSAGPLRARAVISCTGGLSRPAVPAIAGLAGFAGPSFHSARWDPQADLTGKEVAVIGTGASGIQAVPALARTAARLTVYQRSPPWLLPRADRPISPWVRRLFARWPALQSLRRAAIYLRNEALGTGFAYAPSLLRLGARAAHWHLARSVRDPALRAKLLPDYALGCKRVLLSDDYYPALQRPNVDLVTEPIAEVLPQGIATLGRGGQRRERRHDALVLCTGFAAAEAVAPFEVLGRGGRSLEAQWQDGAEAYLGTTVAGFPNLFLIVGPNTGLGHNSMVYMIESQVAYIDDCLRTLAAQGARALEVRPDVQRRYNQRLHERLGRSVWNTGGCNSWYRTRGGKNTTLWPGYTFEFRWRTRRLRPGDYTFS